MPLKKASGSSKKAINKAVSENMKELSSSSAKPRSQKQKIAIAESAARKGKKKK